jgi:hypothetical protein
VWRMFMDFGAALTDMWRAIALFVPKAVGFIAILLIGFVIARLLRKGVKRLLERFGFDRAVRRGGMTRFLAGGRWEASDIVAMLAYYTVLLFTLQLAFGIWGPNAVSDLIAAVVAWLPKAIVAIIIVVVAAALASAVKEVIASMLSSLSYGKVLANLAAVFIVGLGVIAALNQIGIATSVTTPVLITVLATIGGILVVGVGGGMIRPMQERWERWLSKAEDESGVVREKVQAYAETRREAMQAAAAARREVENAPAVGMQPVDTTYAQGKASVATPPLYPPPQPPSVVPRPDAPTVPAPANLNQRNNWPTERHTDQPNQPDRPNGWPVWGEPGHESAPADGGVREGEPLPGGSEPGQTQVVAPRPEPVQGHVPAEQVNEHADQVREEAAQEQAREPGPAEQPPSPVSPSGRQGERANGGRSKAKAVRAAAPNQRRADDAPTQILRKIDPGDESR